MLRFGCVCVNTVAPTKGERDKMMNTVANTENAVCVYDPAGH